MNLIFDRDYFERRLHRSRQLAAMETNASIRDLYLDYVRHYEQALEHAPEPQSHSA